MSCAGLENRAAVSVRIGMPACAFNRGSGLRAATIESRSLFPLASGRQPLAIMAGEPR